VISHCRTIQSAANNRRITYCVAAKFPYTFCGHEHESGATAFVSTGEAPTRSSFK
jgi:hypothetical protein